MTTEIAEQTLHNLELVQFLDSRSCVVVWPDGNPSMADLFENFENLGLRPATHEPHQADAGCTGTKHYFTFEPTSYSPAALQHVARAFSARLRGETPLDSYSRLIGAVEISWRDAALMRAVCRFLVQAQLGLSQDYIVDVLEARPDFVRAVLTLFYARFDPDVTERADDVAAAEAALTLLVVGATTLDQDRILRGFQSFVAATLRTNWFQSLPGGSPKPYVSFKLAPRSSADPDETVPYREIFVHGPTVEGVHLRTSLVARGGLRWSDRPEDYRTEAFSLMTTQSVKNSPIVPSGAKGAFVVRGTAHPSPADALAAYSTFIRGMLDVTDNLVDGHAVRDPATVAYDGEDAYLVVAADKGTARFSDTANDISAEYGFWLGDAFASGGSAGYDHKAMGITARGAWVAVRRHFLERGLDVDVDEFTTVGIGDMSGDVFGNGMLLSRRTKLVAAFDHRHIFVDPTPDCDASYAERRRLFDAPGSSWSDYDRTLISPGGGVWSRAAKSIELPESAKAALGTNESVLTPPELIKAILRAPVDLLWNGGIGTYVKSTAESESDAADPANDAVRVDGATVRATVVGEGGNLGFTQRARIEYAGRGGRINADFIDNAAGVATSDLEVNLKIALNTVAGLDSAARNALLSAATTDVANAVLTASADQTLAISVAEHRAPSLLDQHERLIADLSTAGSAGRQLEALPTHATFAARARAGLGLLRPELAVLVAESKNRLTAELLDSTTPDNPIFADRLIEYFPPAIRTAVGSQVQSHRLARRIRATSIADEMVNRLGPGTFYRLEERMGVRSPQAALAYAVVSTVLDSEGIRARILRSELGVEETLQLLSRLQHLVESEMTWVLRRPGVSGRLGVDPRADIARWSAGVAALDTPGDLRDRIEALFGALSFADAAVQEDIPVDLVKSVHDELATHLDLVDVLVDADRAVGTSHWEVMGSAAVHDRLGERFAELVAKVLEDGRDRPDPVPFWVASNTSVVQRFCALMGRVRRDGTLDTARLCTVEAELELMLR